MLEAFIWRLDEHKAEIEQGKVIKMEVTDCDIYEKKVVKAIVSPSADALPDGEDLWIKDEREELMPVPWRIKVIEELNELYARPSRGLKVGG